jgi:hypothetical protein
MNHEPAAATHAGILQLNELLHRWVSLAEAGLSQMEKGRPESVAGLENQTIEQAGLLKQWHELEQRFSAELRSKPSLREQAVLLAELRLAAQKAVAINRRIELTLRNRERFVASRLQALLWAAGASDTYSSAGSAQRAAISGGSIIAT